MKRSHSNFIDHLTGKHTDWRTSKRRCTICAYLRETYDDCSHATCCGHLSQCPNCGGDMELGARQCADCARFERGRTE